MELYSKTQQARKMGWVILKSVEIRGEGAQAPGAVTMCQVGGEHPLVIHFFNAQDGGFHNGDYCRDRASAEEAYAKRVRRFTRT